MNTIKKALRQIVDLYAMSPSRLQEEVTRLTGNAPSLYDVILKDNKTNAYF